MGSNAEIIVFAAAAVAIGANPVCPGVVVVVVVVFVLGIDQS